MIYECVNESDMSKCKTIFGDDISDVDTPLTIACRRGNVDVVKILLCHGMSSSFKAPSGEYPLIAAIEMKQIDVINTLLQYGVNVDCISKEGKPAICLACELGSSNIEVVRLLLRYPCNINTTGPFGSNALHVCCCDDAKIDIARMLILRGADVNYKDKNGSTPIILCAMSGAVGIASLLLQNACDASLVDSYGNNPLHISCRIGGTDGEKIVALCTCNGVPVDTANSWDDYPLHVATKYNHDRMLSILLEAGSMIDSKDRQGDTPLGIASIHNHISIIKLLIQYGACINSINSEGNTPLHLACRLNHFEIVGMLLDASECDLSIVNAYGNSAFHQAAAGDSAESLELLLTREKGLVSTVESHRVESVDNYLQIAVVPSLERYHDLPNSFGDTPLYFAYYNYGTDNDCVRMLIESGATGDALNEEGDSVMFLACECGDVGLVEALVRNGSNPAKCAEKGRCPIDLLDPTDLKNILRCWNWQRRRAFLLFLYRYGLVRSSGVSACARIGASLTATHSEISSRGSSCMDGSGGAAGGVGGYYCRSTPSAQLSNGSANSGEWTREEEAKKLKRKQKYASCRSKYLHSAVFQNITICRAIAACL